MASFREESAGGVPGSAVVEMLLATSLLSPALGFASRDGRGVRPYTRRTYQCGYSEVIKARDNILGTSG